MLFFRLHSGWLAAEIYKRQINKRIIKGTNGISISSMPTTKFSINHASEKKKPNMSFCNVNCNGSLILIVKKSTRKLEYITSYIW